MNKIETIIKEIAEKHISAAGEEIYKILKDRYQSRFDATNGRYELQLDDCIAMAALTLNPHYYDPCGDWDGYNRYFPIDKWIENHVTCAAEEERDEEEERRR